MLTISLLIRIKKVRIWSGVLFRQNNVMIHQNLNLRINILARDDERESVLLYLNDDVQMIILQFLTNNELYQLKFLCRRFYMIIWLSPFFKKLDYYREIAHDIVDTDKLYECFIDLYDNFLFSKLFQQFQSSTLFFFKIIWNQLRIIFYVLMFYFTCLIAQDRIML